MSRIATDNSLLVAVLITAALAAGGCGDSGDPAPKSPPDGPLNVILISVDTLRYDHLSYTGYSRPTSPRIDELAGQSIQYENAFAPRGQTWPSLTSVMTGLHPISHGVRHNGEMLRKEIPTLAEVLKSQGYRTAAFLTNYCRAPNRGFDVKKIYHVLGEPHSSWDTTITEQTLEWIAKRKGKRPFLLWTHLVGPHADFAPPPPYDTMFDTGYRGTITGSKESHLDSIVLGDIQPTPEDKDYLLALYDGEVAFIDFLVGRVLDALKERDLLERSIVVFFSDHGEELLDHHNYLYHSCSIYDSVLRVPLLIRLPGERHAGRKVNGLVSLVDLLPTMLELTGSPLPLRIEGQSLLRGLDEVLPGQEFVMAEWARSSGDRALGDDPARAVNGKRPKRIYAIRTPRYKYIYNPGGFAPANQPFEKRPGTGFPYAERELYDVQNDPGETKNLAAREPDLARRLEAEIRRWLDPDHRVPAWSEAPDAQTREALKALGYVDVEDSPPEDEPRGVPPGKKDG